MMSDSTQAGRQPLHTILLATDFSENARVALERACELARIHSAHLAITHVIPAPYYPGVGFEAVPIPPDLEQQANAEASLALDKWVEIARAEGLDASQRLERGVAEARVVSLAEELAADLIVTGTRGTTGFQHLLLGSVAEEIVRQAPCPVLTVHPTDGGSFEGLRTVLVPSDFSEPAEQAVGAAARVLPPADAVQYVLLHVFMPPTFMAPPLMSNLAPPGFSKEIEEAALQRLERLAEPLRAQGLTVAVEARAGDSTSTILDCAGEHDAGLIAMGTRGLSKLKRVFLGSTTQRIVQHASCPVLSVHNEASGLR